LRLRASSLTPQFTSRPPAPRMPRVPHSLPEADADACVHEIEIMANLPPHPCVLELVGHVRRPSLGGRGDEILLLCGHCSRGSLAEYLVGRRAWPTPLDGLAVRRIFAQACAAVAHLHALGFCHRDVKPENLLLSDSNYWMLCDFGSVRSAPFQFIDRETSLQELTEEQERISRSTTPQYRPPEMFDLRLGEPVYTMADVWALGVLLYALMRGRNLLGSPGEERLACLSFDPSKALSDEALGSMTALADERELLVRLLRGALTKSAAARPSAEQLLRLAADKDAEGLSELAKVRSGLVTLRSFEARDLLLGCCGGRQNVYLRIRCGGERRVTPIISAASMTTRSSGSAHDWPDMNLAVAAHSLASVEISAWRRCRLLPDIFLGRAFVPLTESSHEPAWHTLEKASGPTSGTVRIAFDWNA